MSDEERPPSAAHLVVRVELIVPLPGGPDSMDTGQKGDLARELAARCEWACPEVVAASMFHWNTERG